MAVKVLIEIQDKKAKSLLEMLKGLPYVKTKLISSEKALLLEEIQESVDNLKLVRKGKMKARPAKALVNVI